MSSLPFVGPVLVGLAEIVMQQDIAETSLHLCQGVLQSVGTNHGLELNVRMGMDNMLDNILEDREAVDQKLVVMLEVLFLYGLLSVAKQEDQ